MVSLMRLVLRYYELCCYQSILTMLVSNRYSIYTHPLKILYTLLKTENNQDSHILLYYLGKHHYKQDPSKWGVPWCFLLQRGRCIARCGRLESVDDWRLQGASASFSSTLFFICNYLIKKTLLYSLWAQLCVVLRMNICCLYPEYRGVWH